MLSIDSVLSPLGKEQYKLITHQVKLNELIAKQLLTKSKELRLLKTLVTTNLLHIRGVIVEPELAVKKIKLGDLFFDISLTKDEIHNESEIHLDISKFRIYNPRRKLDLWNWINKYRGIVQQRIVEGFTGEDSPFFEIETGKKIGFDVKFILDTIPTEVSLLGKIDVKNIGFERRKIVWYIESNIVLKSIIDFLGPAYIEVEKVDMNQDALKLLTDTQFDEA